jgi:HK97 gp10 family phage protein
MAVVITGMDSLMRKLDAMGGNVMGALTRAVKTTVLSGISEAQANIHNRTGNLAQSLVHGSDTKVSAEKIEGIVATSLDYGLYLETGTETEFGSVRMPAYPFMMPSLEANKPVFKGEARKELLKEIRKMGG